MNSGTLAISESSEGEEEDALDTLYGERLAGIWRPRRRRSDRSTGRSVFRLQENDDPPAILVGETAGAGRAPQLLLRCAELCRGGAKTGQESNLPNIGYRANNALVAHGEAIIIPSGATERVQYEAELVVVISRKAKHLSESEALSRVLGWTIGNDVSERTWQASDRTSWRAKNTDTFKADGAVD
jgi:hypothetical protein